MLQVTSWDGTESKTDTSSDEWSSDEDEWESGGESWSSDDGGDVHATAKDAVHLFKSALKGESESVGKLLAGLKCVEFVVSGRARGWGL